MKYFVITIMLVALLAFAGCSDDSSTTPTADVPAFRTVPHAGAVDVDPSDSIHIMFHEPIDTMQFHNWFFCIDSAAHDALVDSLRHGMMGMGHHHQDSAAFYNRMHDRMLEGNFYWFNGGDSCVFQPVSPFDDDTEYVLHFRYEMKNAHGRHVYHMGQLLNEDLTIRFRTQP